MTHFPLIERSGSEADIRLSELAVGYDVEELQHWQDAKCLLVKPRRSKHKGPCRLPADSKRKQDLLNAHEPDSNGNLFGRPVSVYWHQPVHNWPEFYWSNTLVRDEEYEPANIVYEAWRASDRTSDFKKSSLPPAERGVYAHGTAILRRALPQQFFSDFASLVEANMDQLRHRKKPHETNIDMFAFRSGEVCFFEVKRKSERVLAHQELVLAFIAFALQKRWPPALPAPTFRVGFVRLTDALRPNTKQLKSHAGRPIRIRLPPGW